MSILRKAGVLSASLLPAVSVFAEGASSSIDLSAASTAVTNMQTAITGFITGDLMTAILAVIGAGLALFVLFLAVKFIRRGTQKAA